MGGTTKHTVALRAESTEAGGDTGARFRVVTPSPRLRGGLALCLAAALALIAGHALWSALRWDGLEASEAWIWAADSPVDDGPDAFVAVRDFDLPFEPEQAELTLLADEEYWAILNGLPVGAGRYWLGRAPDRYDVLPLVARGSNRLTVELRSRRGIGGLVGVLRIRGGGQEVEIPTDERWRIVREHSAALMGTAEPLGPSAAPAIWGRPPLGRWGRLLEPQPVPILAEVRSSEMPLDPRRYRIGPRPRGWRRYQRQRHDPEPLGPWITLDWGEEVYAYISLGMADGEGVRGLLWASPEEIDPNVEVWSAAVVGLPGRTWWTDVEPRRFRYLYVLGVDTLTLAEAYPVAGKAAGRLPSGPTAPPGVWGLTPPNLTAPVEDEVRRDLEGVPGLAGR